jgi:hypothetical protein
MSDPALVNDADFRLAIEPYATMLEEVAAAGYASVHGATAESLQDPAAVSEAMGELAEQDRYAGVWDHTPIDTANTHIALLLTAGEDAMRTFAAAILAEHTPVYAYIPLTRNGLECLALAHWLDAPGIGVRERIRRSLNERIASAAEQAKLGGALNPEPGRQQRLLQAEALGYEITKGRHMFKHFAPQRPTITAHVKRVLGHDELGRVLYSYTSAISHGTIWGLVERIEAPDDPGPVVRAGVAITSSNIGLMAAALVMAHASAYGGFIEHMGWDEPRWRAALERAWKTIGHLVGPNRTRAATIASAPEWRLDTAGGLWVPEPS